MLWFDRHRRFRDQLSTYIDGGLDAAAAGRLEAHLAGCESCRVEARQLRDTVAALAELPKAEAPRSFALSPERLAAPRPAAAAPPLAFAARLAAVSVAAALALVLVVDLGDLGRDGGPAQAPEAQMGSQRQEQPTAPGEAVPPNGEDQDATGYAADRETTARAAPEPAAGGAAPAAAPSDGGIDALTVAEIGLAAALAVLVAGGLALAFVERRRRRL